MCAGIFGGALICGVLVGGINVGCILAGERDGRNCAVTGTITIGASVAGAITTGESVWGITAGSTLGGFATDALAIAPALLAPLEVLA